MSENVKTYEGMFLVDAGKDFETASAPVQTILGRCEASILSIKPWEERRLAYDIQGRKRGLYILAYFKADPARIGEIEHDCQLSEEILRVMLLRGDQLTDEQINAETPATNAPAPTTETPSDDPPGDDRPARRPRRDDDNSDADGGNGGDDSKDADDSDD